MHFHLIEGLVQALFESDKIHLGFFELRLQGQKKIYSYVIHQFSSYHIATEFSSVQEAWCIRMWLVYGPMRPLTLICRVFDRCSSRTSDIHVFFVQYPMKCGLYTLSGASSFAVCSYILQLLAFSSIPSFLIMIIFIEKKEEQTSQYSLPQLPPCSAKFEDH